MSPFVSIIIPVYNSDKYLERCLDSILTQTFSDFELILVDDGSSDTSWDICTRYAQRDQRVRAIRQPANKGVSAARNSGLDCAAGKWIYFCDSDDFLNKDSLKILTGFTDDSVDLVLAGYTRITTEEEAIHSFSYSRKVDRIKAIERYFETGKDRIQSFLWNRLFRREIIEANMIRFNESIFYKEDGLFVVRYMCLMRNDVFYASSPVYNYVIHSGSAMGMVTNTVTDKFLTNLDARILSLDELKRHVRIDAVVRKAKESVFNFELWVFAIMKENHHFDYKILFSIVVKTVKSIGLFSYIRHLSLIIVNSIKNHIQISILL